MRSIIFTFLVLAFSQVSVAIAADYEFPIENAKMYPAKSYLFTHTYSLSAMGGSSECLAITTPIESSSEPVYYLKFNGGKKFLVLSPDIIKNVKLEKEGELYKYSVNYSISKNNDGNYPIEKVMIALTKKCSNCFFESVKVLSVEMADPYTTSKKTQIECTR